MTVSDFWNILPVMDDDKSHTFHCQRLHVTVHFPWVVLNTTELVHTCFYPVNGVCMLCLTLFWDSRLRLSCWSLFSPNPHTPLLSISLKKHSSLHHWNTQVHTQIYINTMWGDSYQPLSPQKNTEHSEMWCEQWRMLNWLTEHTVKQRMKVLKWVTVNSM